MLNHLVRLFHTSSSEAPSRSIASCSIALRGEGHRAGPALRTAFAVALSTTAAFALQSVHVVNGGSGATLQNAINAAADGDTVLVHGGTFSACAIVGKSLTLVSEPSLSTQVAGLRIATTSALQRTTVAGLRVVAPAVTPPGFPVDCIVLDQCAGSVRLEGLAASVTTPNGAPALRVTDSPDVVLAVCALTGSNGEGTSVSFAAATPGAGVRSINSRIAAFSCSLQGGIGNNGFTQSPCSNPFVFFNTSGAPGVSLDATSTWFSSGGTCVGGVGGRGVNARCDCFTGSLVPGTNGSAGGAGMDNSPGSAATILGTPLVGGSGGLGGSSANCGSGPGGGGTMGASGVSSTQVVSAFLGAPIALDAPPLVRAGQTLMLTIHGTPGDTALIGRSFETRWVLSLANAGVLLIGPSGRRVPVGVIPASGMLTIGVPASLTVPGSQSSSWFLQAFALDPMGALRIGAPFVTTVLDPSF